MKCSAGAGVCGAVPHFLLEHPYFPTSQGGAEGEERNGA